MPCVYAENWASAVLVNMGDEMLKALSLNKWAVNSKTSMRAHSLGENINDCVVDGWLALALAHLTTRLLFVTLLFHWWDLILFSISFQQSLISSKCITSPCIIYDWPPCLQHSCSGATCRINTTAKNGDRGCDTNLMLTLTCSERESKWFFFPEIYQLEPPD